MKIELKAGQKLTRKEEILLDSHSILNVLNILLAELVFTGEEIKDDSFFSEAMDRIINIKSLLGIIESPGKLITEIQKIIHSVGISLSNANSAVVGTPEEQLLQKRTRNIESISLIIKERLGEIKDQGEQNGSWESATINSVKKRVYDVLKAIELNSNGRFGIVFEENEKSNKDYFFNFKIYSLNNQSIMLPRKFQDTIRDLVANARKYSEPGTNIIAELSETEELLKLTIKDKGIGIPVEEIEKTVGFGYRATNALSHPTMGGGFGLTKAFSLVQKYNGRMWIESEAGKGTEVIIEIPRKL